MRKISWPEDEKAEMKSSQNWLRGFVNLSDVIETKDDAQNLPRSKWGLNP